MDSRTPVERQRAASIAALTRWALVGDRTAATSKARSAFMEGFERRVDPHGKLDPAERAIRAEMLRRAHFKRLSALGAASRTRARQEGRRAS